jgi:hypothetical protein
MKNIISALLLTTVAGSASIAAPTGGKHYLASDRVFPVGGASTGLKHLQSEERSIEIAVYYDMNKDSYDGVTDANRKMFVEYEKRAPASKYNNIGDGHFTPDSDAPRGFKEYKLQEQNAKKQNQIIASKNGFTRFASTQNYYVGLMRAAVTTIYKQFVSIFWA